MTTPTAQERISWPDVLDTARQILAEYDTGVTLRQLFYRLVSRHLIPNTRSAYTALSSTTAEARRAGTFPKLIDHTRGLRRRPTFSDVCDAREWLADIYRRDRTEGQECGVYLAVEKDGLVEQLQSWFSDFGVPIFALRGYCSQSFVDEVSEDVAAAGRPAVLVYAGDYDPSGKDIQRDFVDRTGCFQEVVRIALDREQVEEYALPPMPGKASDTRAARFIEAEGELMQVELDALPPDVLHELYQNAFEQYFDLSAFQAVYALECEERAELLPAAS